MRDFTKLKSALWISPRFLALSDDPRLLIIYIISGPHQTPAGAFRLPDAYGAEDLRWTVCRYRAARSILIDEQFVVFDHDTSEIFVNKWFRHSPPINPAHRKGIHAALGQITSDRVRLEALNQLNKIEEEITARNEAAAVGRSAAAKVQSLNETARMRSVR